MNILTFDIEDWFHILNNPYTRNERQWSNFDSRIHLGMELIYNILEKSKISATFFIVGWIAEKYPDIVKKINNLGCEIGSHTHYHQLIYEQSPKAFYNDVEKSIKTLEDCIGKKVSSFRAPGFSITERNKWAFEIIHELGITKDSSIFPASRAHGGFQCYKTAHPSIVEYNGIKMKEFPINTYSYLNNRIVFSGGGYFRILPYKVIKRLTHQSSYVMAYFHPRDFDINQPVAPGLSSFRRFKSYVGIKKCKIKLEKWINDFTFTDIEQANKSINWDEVTSCLLYTSPSPRD